ncbi:MAG TPA: methylthioribulose 1-phosphate dehydratase [Vicinamibacterales bacterium]|nr:methylthioribulose 1-phosphate dehydratase [Vicinamibacterales bacterium]
MAGTRVSKRDLVLDLAGIGRQFYDRGWVLGTSGNFSAVLSVQPLRLAITASSVHKGTLEPDQILEVDERGRVSSGKGQPSAETLLHLEIVRARGARAILHTHSVWSTILSDLHASAGGLAISGYEMLKGLDGIRTHEHREWIPIVPNDQDMPRLALEVRKTLEREQAAHAFLLQRHGLYTWGQTLADAARHVEILEFLLEATGRSASAMGNYQWS